MKGRQYLNSMSSGWRESERKDGGGVKKKERKEGNGDKLTKEKQKPSNHLIIGILNLE